MDKLKVEIKLAGLGYPVITTQLKRDKKKAIYLRSDSFYEVFKIKVRKAGKIFGKLFPEREVYPCSEDFGYTAWCFDDKTRAFDKYDEI